MNEIWTPAAITALGGVTVAVIGAGVGGCVTVLRAIRDLKSDTARVTTKTDAQTKQLETLDSKADIASAAAQQAAANTEGELTKVQLRLDGVTAELIAAKATIEAQNKLLEMMSRALHASVPASAPPTIVTVPAATTPQSAPSVQVPGGRRADDKS